jgi:hypothetical protein
MVCIVMKLVTRRLNEDRSLILSKIYKISMYNLLDSLYFLQDKSIYICILHFNDDIRPHSRPESRQSNSWGLF